MARLKSKDVHKFGGVDALGSTTMEGNKHELSHVEAKSEKTHLEDDLGTGKPVIMRSFTFKLDKTLFKVASPSRQEIFDSHVKGIEMFLFKDGLIFEKQHEPRILFNKKLTHYTIFVVATPARGNTLVDQTQTLSQISNG